MSKTTTLLFFLSLVFCASCGITMRNPHIIDHIEKKRVKVTFKTVINSTGTEQLHYKFRIPVNIDYRQKILNMKFTPEPDSLYDEGTERFADYLLVNINGEETLTVELEMELFRYDLEISNINNILINTEYNPDDYLEDEKKIESDDTEIIALAATIQGNTEEDIIKGIYKTVIDKIDYDMSYNHRKSWKGAKISLNQGVGVCSDFTDLFVALCRAKGIPARYVSGYTARNGESQNGHAWAEVFLKKHGWVPFDPTWGDDILADTDYKHNKPVYLTLLRSKRDNQTYYYYRGGAPEIKRTVAFEILGELNTLDDKITKHNLNKLWDDPYVVSKIHRYRDNYTNYIKKKLSKNKKAEIMQKIVDLSFLPRPLLKEEMHKLKSIITTEKQNLKKQNRAKNNIVKRILWLGIFRLNKEGVHQTETATQENKGGNNNEV